MKKHTPVIIAASQYTQPEDTREPLDPLSLMIKTGQSALEEAGTDDLRELIDMVYVINIFSWLYKDAPGELSKALGLNPDKKAYSNIGGNMPQTIVNKVANLIAHGDCKAVLITGGEAEYSIRKARRNGINLNWPERQNPEYMDPGNDFFADEIEQHYGLLTPIALYSLLETARRAASGRNHKEHLTYAGNKLEKFSRIASENPYAWVKYPYSAEEISAVTPKNRYITYPFVKRTVANIGVDQSSALIMTTEEVADSLGINPEHRVYPMGGADFENPYFLKIRPKLYDSPALRKASRLALEQADITLSDIDMFDIYSCFPCIIEIAQKEIGIPEDDPRDLTVIGGLPFFGGPFNSYSLHAIVSSVERIRKNPSLKIMVHANGGVNTKQSIGIYGSKPSPNPWGERDDSAVQKAILKNSLPELVIRATGKLTVEAYSIDFDRQGKPEKGLVMGKLDNGGRAIAIIDTFGGILDRFEEINFVGLSGEISYNEGRRFNFVKLNVNE